MSNYTIAGAAMAPITAAQISQIDLGGYSVGEKKLPNKKISFDVHTAHNGYVIRVSQNTFGIEDDMYVINDDQDLGQELGKIITHFTLSKHE
jgi:hypothetical protein